MLGDDEENWSRSYCLRYIFGGVLRDLVSSHSLMHLTKRNLLAMNDPAIMELEEICQYNLVFMSCYDNQNLFIKGEIK